MADNRVILKRSAVADKAPQTSDIEYGELAVNYTDGRIYFRNSSNQIQFFERVDVNVKNNLNALLNNIDTNVLTSDGTFTADTLVLASYPNTALPTPDTRGELIYVDNSDDYIESGYVDAGYAPEGGVASDDTIAFSNGEEWRQFSRVALSGEYDDLLNVPPSTQVSASPPSSPIEGTLWWDTDDGNLYIYYLDGDSAQWVPATATIVGPQGIQGPQGEKGDTGDTGPQGLPGIQGLAGEGIITGGTTGQVLAKASNADYDTEWLNISSEEVNATDDSSSTTLFPIMVDSTGTDTLVRAASSNLEFDASNGTLSATSYTETSSIRYKKNVRDIKDALSIVRRMKGVEFDRKDDTSINEYGFIAEDLYEILPSLIKLNDEGNPDSVYYTRIIAWLVESIKELENKVSRIENG